MLISGIILSLLIKTSIVFNCFVEQINAFNESLPIPGFMNYSTISSLSLPVFELNQKYLEIYQKHEISKHFVGGSNDPETYSWLLPDAVRLFARLFHDREKIGRVPHLDITARKRDRRSASPFITDDAFRTHCAPYLCLEDDIERNAKEPMTGDNCHIESAGYSRINCTCIFVMASLLPVFVEREVPKLKENNIHFSLVTDRFNDQSVPDSQTLSGLNLPRWSLKQHLQDLYDEGILISHHGINTWWEDYKTTPRPKYLHCVPIGLETRDCTFGRNLTDYLHHMHESLRAHHRQEIKPKELLLVPLDGNYHNNKPDRYHAETAIRKNGFSTSRMSHPDWMQAITRHKFVLAPFGHGLDTHRLTEILLMGGVPVIRQSTISSCYDDTDNVIGDGLSRGSIPLVVVNSWSDVTKSRLEQEWARISAVPPHHWDWRRLFVDHWIERIDYPRPHSADIELFGPSRNSTY